MPEFSWNFKRRRGMVYTKTMTLRYQTGVATITQLIIMLVLNFITQTQAAVQACVDHTGCVSGIVINALFVIVLAIWLLFLSALGYMAQDKRSRRFATALIACEGLVVIVTFFNMRHFPNKLGLITSIVDCALAIWVIVLAWRIRQAGGGRIVAKATTRPRSAPHGADPRKRLQH